jgi:hypothetical protein
MALRISTAKLRKMVIAYLTIYMLPALLTTAAITLWPMVNYLKEEVRKSFLNGATVRAAAINERLDKMLKITEQASQRVGLIGQMEDYSHGDIGLAALKTYFDSRYRLVIALFSDITGISQFSSPPPPTN